MLNNPTKHDFNVGDIVIVMCISDSETAIITDIIKEHCKFPIVVRRFSTPDSDWNAAPIELKKIS